MLFDNFFLGLPAWAFPGWKDRYFSEKPSRLASYASVFNSVEGNTTFYRTPDPGTVERWRDAVANRAFRFCFKLPREVTHERHPDLKALLGFLRVVDPLSDYLGPLLVQFPATLGPSDLKTFTRVFSELEKAFSFVIEVRHRAFFNKPELLEPTLEQFGAGRVMLDSRPLYEGDRRHPEVLDALHEKPDVPVLSAVYNSIALVRLILHPDIVSNRRYIEDWAKRVAAYVKQDIAAYMMIHCPNNLHCPSLAQAFHETLRQQDSMSGLPAFPSWPVPQQQELL